MGSFWSSSAFIAFAQGKLERAARLFGATGAALETIQSQVDTYPVLRTHHERDVAAAHSGPATANFSAALAAGRALSLVEAAAYALADDEPELTPAAPAGRASGQAAAGPLSPREREVVALVARGLSNREIAAQLIITERTAGAHIEHILDKLGFAGRTQIGVWASEQGLVARHLS